MQVALCSHVVYVVQVLLCTVVITFVPVVVLFLFTW